MTFSELFNLIACKVSKCRRLVLHSTEDGIGGRCVSCGRLWGWMTRAELRAAIEGKRADAD